jgi:hypothetical protein
VTTEPLKGAAEAADLPSAKPPIVVAAASAIMVVRNMGYLLHFGMRACIRIASRLRSYLVGTELDLSTEFTPP